MFLTRKTHKNEKDTLNKKTIKINNTKMKKNQQKQMK